MLEAAAKNTPFHHLTTAVKATTITPAIPQNMSSQDNKIMETKNIQQKHHATHCNTSTSVISVDSTWETQSWVHQPGELHAHRRFSAPVSFVHFFLSFADSPNQSELDRVLVR